MLKIEKRSFRSLSLIAALALVLSVLSVGSAAANGFINGPDEPGPIVVRSADDTFFLLFNTDRESGLVSLIRLPDAPSHIIPCGGTQPLDGADLQLVFHQNGTINQLLIGRQVHAHVYDRPSFLAALRSGGLCGAIASQTPLAQGLVDFTAHDNDTFFTGIHANAFGWSANGILYSVADGSPLRYLSISRGVVSSDGTLVHLVSTISLSPVTAP